MSLHAVEPKPPGPLGRHPRTAAANEFCELLGALGISRPEFARLLNYSQKAIRNWAGGSRRVPRENLILLRLVRIGAITIDQIADAARPQCGLVKPVVGPAVDREPAPEIGVGFFQLSGETCKWPLWGNETPTVSEMRFCGGRTIAGSSYCGEHSARARRVRRNA
jgi:hypothetical protein